MQFSSRSIDLIQTHSAYAARYKGPYLSRDRFALPIVQVAHQAIGRYGIPIEYLPGIKRSLVSLVGTLKQRSYIWILPLSLKPVFTRGPFGGLWKSKEVDLLVDSLMLTALIHQKALWEFETDLAPMLLVDLTCGFERICDWINRGLPIEPERNDLIKLADAESVNARLGGMRN